MSTSTPTPPPIALKILVIGASSVGKSSLVLRYDSNQFLDPEEVTATVGVDFKVKMVNKRGKRWKLAIWDTAGQERFRTLTNSYYRNAHSVILVYDITARDTFEALSSWIQELDTFSGTTASKDVVRMIVANKVDKEHSRVVSTAEGAAFAASRHPPWLFMECSAKVSGNEGVGVEALFSRVVDEILDRPQLFATKPLTVRPPGTFPRNDRVVSLDQEMSGSSSWCSC